MTKEDAMKLAQQVQDRKVKSYVQAAEQLAEFLLAQDSKEKLDQKCAWCGALKYVSPGYVEKVNPDGTAVIRFGGEKPDV